MLCAFTISIIDLAFPQILNYLNKNPEVREINQGFIRNEGLLISLKNDRTVEKSDEE